MPALEPAPTPVKWLRSLQRFGMRPGLDRTRRLLDELGHPEEGLRFFHVAGTNGKGSVCAFLSSVLSLQGVVGTFTSPAFDGYRGRFALGDDRITRDDFVRLAAQVQEASERVVAEGGEPPTEFEALTVMALLYFHERRPDFVVWETGLGGRYDSTNVVEPLVCAITNVGWDHVEVLGPTLADIAFDKAGIIKPNVPLITGAEDVAYSVIARVAAAAPAPVYRLGMSFSAVREAFGPTGQRIWYRGVQQDVCGIEVPLFGAHQCDNAAIALAMYEAAVARGACRRMTDEEIRQGILQTRWPGRFEIRHARGVPVVLDGAHNPDGARKFAAALREYSEVTGLERRKWTMVVGILSDKEAGPMLAAVLPLAGRVIAVAPNNPRAIRPDELARMIRDYVGQCNVTTAPTVADAIREALDDGEPVACWGSLYIVEEARKAMEKH